MIIHDITRLIVLLSLHKILSGDGSGHRGDTLQGFACALSAFLRVFHVVEKGFGSERDRFCYDGEQKSHLLYHTVSGLAVDAAV